MLRRTFLAAAVSTMGLAAPAVAADGPLRVVATFSILGDMAARIGGERIALTTLVGPGGDAHVYQPTPADARALREADVLIVNGLEFEGWLDRLVEAAEFEGARIVATAAVDPLPFGDGHGDDDDHADHDAEEHDAHDHDDHAKEEHGHEDHDDHDGHEGHDHGASDPHAWQSLTNAVAYVDAVAAGLAAARPDGAGAFYAARAAYVAEIEALEAEIAALMAAIPQESRTVVTSHDAFGYFAAAHDMRFEAPQGISTESAASAKDVAALIRQIREEGIRAVFVETVADARLIEQIARDTDATVGGALYADSLSGPDGPAGTYLDMMRHNAVTIATALGAGN